MRIHKVSIASLFCLALAGTVLVGCATEPPADTNVGVPEVTQETKDRLHTSSPPGAASNQASQSAATPQSPPPTGE